MKFTNFCGIFATLFVTTTIILLASCSQDDDYYESDMYTLAEMGTRLGGDPEDPPHPQTYFLRAGSADEQFEVPGTNEKLKVSYHLQWGEISDPRLYSAEANVTYLDCENGSSSVHSLNAMGLDTTILEYEYVDLVDNHLPARNIGGYFVLDGIVVYYKEAKRIGNSNIYYHKIDTVCASIRWKIPEELIYLQ